MVCTHLTCSPTASQRSRRDPGSIRRKGGALEGPHRSEYMSRISDRLEAKLRSELERAWSTRTEHAVSARGRTMITSNITHRRAFIR